MGTDFSNLQLNTGVYILQLFASSHDGKFFKLEKFGKLFKEHKRRRKKREKRGGGERVKKRKKEGKDRGEGANREEKRGKNREEILPKLGRHFTVIKEVINPSCRRISSQGNFFPSWEEYLPWLGRIPSLIEKNIFPG